MWFDIIDVMQSHRLQALLVLLSFLSALCCFSCQARFTPFLRRATITTHGRKSPPQCTTSLWESYGSTRWATPFEGSNSAFFHMSSHPFLLFFFCLSPVGGDRRGESHYWRPLPPEVCTLQLLLQRRGQEGEGTHRFNISLLIFSVLCTNLNCALLPFCNSGWLISSSSLQVTGVVMDKDGKAHYVLSGTWDEKLEFSRVMQSSRGGENGTEGKQKTVYQTLKAREVWRRNPLP